MAKVRGEATEQVLLDSLKSALRDLEELRLVMPAEAEHVSALKSALRAKIDAIENKKERPRRASLVL